jgi:Fur family ferric uptake transcriptional regulator
MPPEVNGGTALNALSTHHRDNGDAAVALQQLQARLRERGQRLTPQRLLILELVYARGDHITADELLIEAQQRYPYLNVSTVYRTLELLRDVGIVAETDLGDGVRQFALLSDDRHHHLVCLNCGHVLDIGDDLLGTLRERLVADYGFVARIDHLALFGLCSYCAAASPAGATAAAES